MMSKKEAANFGMVVTSTPFLNSKPFYVPFDLGFIHSFISAQSALLLDLKHVKVETNYRIKLPNHSILNYRYLL